MSVEVKPRTYSVEDASKVLGVSRQTMYDLCRSKGFPAIRVGRRIRIPIETFHIWINNSGGNTYEQ